MPTYQTLVEALGLEGAQRVCAEFGGVKLWIATVNTSHHQVTRRADQLSTSLEVELRLGTELSGKLSAALDGQFFRRPGLISALYDDVEKMDQVIISLRPILRCLGPVRYGAEVVCQWMRGL
jgi:hypothetical protein